MNLKKISSITISSVKNKDIYKTVMWCTVILKHWWKKQLNNKKDIKTLHDNIQIVT